MQACGEQLGGNDGEGIAVAVCGFGYADHQGGGVIRTVAHVSFVWSDAAAA